MTTEWLSPGDPNSYARPEECIVTDLSLDVQVDFSRKVIAGTATYDCERRQDGIDVLVSCSLSPSLSFSPSLPLLLQTVRILLNKLWSSGVRHRWIDYF